MKGCYFKVLCSVHKLSISQPCDVMFIHLLSNYILKVTSVWSWNRNNSHCNTRKQGSAMSPFVLLYANFQRKHGKNISAPLIRWPLGMAWWLVFKGSFLLLCYAENVIKGTLGATMNLKITIAVVFLTMLLYFIPFKKNWYLKNCLADNGCCTASLQRQEIILWNVRTKYCFWAKPCISAKRWSAFLFLQTSPPV